MTLGQFGTTLNDELNRLANGGTYRAKDQLVDEALAAKQWANREYITPYSTDTVGILNEIALLGLDKRNWLDFNGVCNYIAGTTGLPAAAALRQVQNTSDILTGSAAYYVDATAPQNWSSLGYVYQSGNGNRMSIPDEAALDITGDIDIRVQVAADDWSTGTQQFITKDNISGSDRSWYFANSLGFAQFVWWDSGGTVRVATCDTLLGFTNGSINWVRVTLDVNNGAGTPQYEVKFWKSTDGTTYTQVGSTVTGTIGATTIRADASPVQIGASNTSGTGSPMIGKFYAAQIFASIDGTNKRLDFNISRDYKSTDSNTFFALTGQTVSLLGNIGDVRNLGTAGSLLPTTVGSSTAADSNDPKFLDHTGTNYVYLPGVSGNSLSVPDSDALDITGDLDIRVKLATDNWSQDFAMLASKRDGNSGVAADQYSWMFHLSSSNDRLVLQHSANGTTSVNTEAQARSSVDYGIANGTTKWVRVTLDVDNGASGHDIKYYTSDDGVTWTQLGTTITLSGTTSVFAGTAPVRIGARLTGNGDVIAAKIFNTQIYNGIDGTKVLDVDTSVITAGSATSFTAVTGQTVTINRSTSGRKTVAVTQPTWLFGTDDYMEVNNRYMASGTYLYLPGVASNYASAPDSAALDITGDLDVRVKVAFDDWTPSAGQAIIAKRASGGTQQSWSLIINTNGTLIFNWSTNGTTYSLTATSTVAPTVADGATIWVRATLDVDNGASGNTVTFFTSTDGTTWSQLGTTITQAGTTSIFNSTASLEIGSWLSGANPIRGKFFRAQVLDGIDGTVAFDANFETSITSLNQASFTESSANAATVTINRSGSAYRSAGITAAGYLYPGATNTFSASATDFLNFGASDSFTALVVARNWLNSGDSFYMAKSINGISATMVGWVLYNNSTVEPGQLSARIGDGTNRVAPTPIQTTAGTLKMVTLARNVNNDTVTEYVGTTNTSLNDTTTGSLSNISTVTIGSIGAGSYMPGEIYAAAVFRSVLTARQIAQISNYFARREAYL